MNTTPVNPPNSVNVISIAFGKMPGSPSGPLPATSARPINGTKQDGLRDRVQTEPRYCLDVAVKDDAARQRTDVRLFGAATFVQLPKLADALEHLPGEREVHIHLGNIAYIDHASLDLLRNFERTRREAGATVVIDRNAPVARRANRPVAEVEQVAGQKTERPAV